MKQPISLDPEPSRVQTITKLVLLPYIKDAKSLQLQLPTKTVDSVNLLIPNDVLEEWLTIEACKGLICLGS